MVITYSWDILTLSVRDEDTDHLNAVVNVKWRKIGTDESGNQAYFEGSTSFSAANVPPEDYIPFNQLTKEVVLSWVKEKIEARITTGEYTFCEDDTINQNIEKQINSIRNPIRPVPLPWANNS